MKRRKNAAAVLLGKRGAKVANAKRTPEERQEFARSAAEARWTDHEYSQKASAVSQRKRRQRLKHGELATETEATPETA